MIEKYSKLIVLLQDKTVSGVSKRLRFQFWQKQLEVRFVAGIAGGYSDF
jgi:hypothetical protein